MRVAKGKSERSEDPARSVAVKRESKELHKNIIAPSGQHVGNKGNYQIFILPHRGRTSVGHDHLYVNLDFPRSSGDEHNIAFKSLDLNERTFYFLNE